MITEKSMSAGYVTQHTFSVFFDMLKLSFIPLSVLRRFTASTTTMSPHWQSEQFWRDFSGCWWGGGSTQPLSLVARRDATPISSIGRKHQDVHPIKAPQQSDSDSHPDTITMVPLTVVEVEWKVAVERSTMRLLVDVGWKEKRGLKWQETLYVEMTDYFILSKK